jgi:hypothetical protein
MENMGWRFRRSRSVGPVRVTLSKGGIGVSVGGPGVRVGVGADGRERATLSLPGTGVSYQTSARGSVHRTGRAVLVGALVVAILGVAACATLLTVAR